jgi:hypothetical protein
MDEIPVETHVKIASNLNSAAIAQMPEDKGVLSRCGIYLFVTKDGSVYDRLDSIVANWTIDAEQAGAGEPTTAPKLESDGDDNPNPESKERTR